MARAATVASALRARRAPSYGWYYDDTGHYAYVLVDGDKKMCDVLCRRLETAVSHVWAKGRAAVRPPTGGSTISLSGSLRRRARPRVRAGTRRGGP